ncbi:sigma-70 family RNA polymerase sigma factor [Euzebya sp.]|uniref:sigma-70 family RNA polymerase sigma factor n=1 Tax=Euzebya sp. TaxID=1971409 RepID=UPI003513CD15
MDIPVHDTTDAPAWPDPATFCADVRGQLVGALVLLGHDWRVAEELAQEALVRTWQRWATIDHPRAFALRCATNLSRSWLRRRLAERRAYRLVSADASTTSDPPDTASAVAVRRAVAALPARQREAVVARYFADLSVVDAAEVMGCAAGTVKALTAQAIANLRRAGLDVTEEESDA